MAGRDLAPQKREVCGAEPTQADTFGGRLHIEWIPKCRGTLVGELR